MTLKDELPARAPEEQPAITIGRRMRDARLARRMTIVEVATACGVTKGYLSKLERDQASPSMATLLRICAVLEVPVPSLFEPSSGELIRSNERRSRNAGGERMQESLLTPTAEKRVQAILGEIEPGGGSGQELYPVEADVEFAFVIRGRLVMRIEEDEITLEEGDAFTFPGHSRHAFYNPDPDAATRVLWILVPAVL